MDIKDKIAIVTGASAGIGLALARLLAEKGATVILAARSADRLKQLEKEIPGSVAIPADMQKQGDIRNLIREVQDKFGRIDILVNNAGQGLLSPVETVDLDEYRGIMELNVFGVLSAMQAVIPVMRKHGGGTILNVSSMVSKNTFPMLAAYVSQAGFPRWTGGRDGGAVAVALRPGAAFEEMSAGLTFGSISAHFGLTNRSRCGDGSERASVSHPGACKPPSGLSRRRRLKSGKKLGSFCRTAVK